MSELRQTPLHTAHLVAHAKMVDFGGWSMPVSYASQIQEHHAVRQKAGMFDVSHMLNIDLTGVDARPFLRRLLANDVAKLTVPGKALYSCMLNHEGGVVDDLIVYFFTETQWRLVVNAACAESDLQWMQQVAQDFQVTLTPRRDLAMIAVQGPEARQFVWQARPQWKALSENLKPFNAAIPDKNVMVARTGYTGEDGFEIVVPAAQVLQLWNDLLAVGVMPCGLGARDTLRLEAGMNLYGQDMTTNTQPAQSGLTWTVSLQDESRDFIGRQAITQQPRKNLFAGLKLLDKGVMRAHMKVVTPFGEGEVTSGTMSPTMGVSIAFARLPLEVQLGDVVQVEIRGKLLNAQVVRLPFVRQGKVLEQE